MVEAQDTRRSPLERPKPGSLASRKKRPLGRRAEKQRIQAIRAGDRDAAESLVKETYEGLFASLVRLSGDRDKAADLTQEAYRVAWKSLPDFEGRARFSTWIYRIAYNLYLNQARRSNKMTHLDPRVEVVDKRPGAEQVASKAQEDRRLRRYIIELPDELRVVVTARFWAEIETREIATLEGVSRSAIRKRLSKAKRILRQRLEERART